jgi:hypothetical protein
MTHEAALARKIEERDWEFVATALLLAMQSAARRLPPGTIDDVLALISLEREEERHDASRE